jgi:hypothetical protein
LRKNSMGFVPRKFGVQARLSEVFDLKPNRQFSYGSV